MKAYLKGYRLLINRSIFKRDNFDVVPDNIFLKKKNSISTMIKIMRLFIKEKNSIKHLNVLLKLKREVNQKNGKNF